ncbi:hypothetical protein ACJ72_05126 [Emergomyces africanus]|uniref:Uncharacterized protein n=1 Tax=Emergomyces africanus TaxID=1955775 RepID=A0A1B7NV63_9EURO|nr:hypothetical protein ACJ72_05126 [Emergomyces africanus]
MTGLNDYFSTNILEGLSSSAKDQILPSDCFLMLEMVLGLVAFVEHPDDDSDSPWQASIAECFGGIIVKMTDESRSQKNDHDGLGWS